MKQEYIEMDVQHVGTVSTVVNKSGTFNDLSSQYESKTFDTGEGNDD